MSMPLPYEIGESIAYETCEDDRATGQIVGVEYVDGGRMLRVLDHEGYTWRVQPNEVLEVLTAPDPSSPAAVLAFLSQ